MIFFRPKLDNWRNIYHLVKSLHQISEAIYIREGCTDTDGHKSHTHHFEALECASSCGVIILSLPPHASHRFQPLDLTFFDHLKSIYNQLLDK